MYVCPTLFQDTSITYPIRNAVVVVSSLAEILTDQEYRRAANAT